MHARESPAPPKKHCLTKQRQWPKLSGNQASLPDDQTIRATAYMIVQSKYFEIVAGLGRASSPRTVQLPHRWWVARWKDAKPRLLHNGSACSCAGLVRPRTPVSEELLAGAHQMT